MREKCPECKKYSLEQQDNFNGECVATKYRCIYCLKSSPIWVKKPSAKSSGFDEAVTN